MEPSFFLAPLDKCLKEGHRLISWKKAFQALSEPDAENNAPNLKSFLQDERSVTQLRFPTQPFLPATLDTKKDLETRTAAVQITPPKTNSYDVEEIKSDALWLSKEAVIDEVSALRIVMLEWQDRSASQLLSGYTEGELISIQQAVGASQLSLSAFLQHFAIPEPAARNQDFDSEDCRHERLLQIYLSERDNITGVYLLLAIENGLHLIGVQDGNQPIGLTGEASWITELWTRIEETVTRSAKRSVSMTAKQLISQNLQAIEQRLSALEKGSTWTLAIEAGNEELERMYMSTQLKEIVRILQLSLVHVSAATEPPDAHNLSEWFQFVDKYGFFEQFQTPFPSQQSLVAPIQILTSTISLQILKLPYSLHQLNTLLVTELEKICYLDEKCFEVINDTIYNAADHASHVASPAILAWSIFLQSLRDITQNRPTDEFMLSDGLEGNSSPIVARQDSIQPTNAVLDLVHNVLRRPYSEDSIQYLAKIAVDETKVFAVITEISQNLGSFINLTDSRLLEYHTRMSLLELVRQGLLLTTYGPEVFEATLSILSCSSPNEEVYKTSTLDLGRRILTNFISDDQILVPGLLEQARVRYPYELSPFLALAKVFCTVKNFDLDQSTSPLALFESAGKFTALLPRDFAGYESVREDENANFVRLSEDLPLFVDLTRRRITGGRDPMSRLISLGSTRDEAEELCIPSGTDGSVLNENKPFVVMWFYEHSVLKYFARLLSRFANTMTENAAYGEETVERDVQSGIVSLFATQLCTLTRPAHHPKPNSHDSDKALWILEEASDGLGRNQDLITVVFDIFEGELSRHAQQMGFDTTSVLSSCIHFLRGVAQVIPNRAWPLLVRSHLLEIDGKGGRISSIMAATDSIFDRFDFTTKCLDLFDALVSDVLSNSVSSRASGSGTALKRFSQHVQPPPTTTPQKIIHKVILSFTKVFVDTLRNSATWHFSSQDQQSYLVSGILTIFQRIVRSVYGYDDSQENSKKFTVALAPAAEYIVHIFLSPDPYDSTMKYLLSLCLQSTRPNASPLSYVSRQSISRQSRAILEFISMMLDIGMLVNSPAVHLQQQMFKAMPLIIRMYVKKEIHRNLIVSMLSSLVKSAATTDKDPPSLLGNLTQDTAKQFLSVLSYRNRPLGSVDLGISTWTLMADIVNHRQPWFTTLLLTGSPPKRAATKNGSNGKEAHSCRAEKTVETSGLDTMLALVLDTLSTTSHMNNLRELAMLKFLASAQANWPWVSRSIRGDAHIVNRMLDYVSSLEDNLSQAEDERANQIQAAALIAEILAMFFHNSRQVGQLPDIKDVASKIGFYRDHGLSVPNYNSSLHGNLKRNFEKCFSGVSPVHYKRLLGISAYGNDFFYDLDFASETLGFSASWSNGKNNGFAAEFERANLNLSVVEAEVKLATSWKSLAIEIGRNVRDEKSVQRQLIEVMRQCLRANIQSDLHEALFESLTQTRIDLVMVLLQRFVANKVKHELMLGLLPLVWQTIKASGQNFELAFSGNNAPYYRSLLQVLLLAIQPHAYIAPSYSFSASTSADGMQPSPKRLKSNQIVSSVLLDVVSDVVGRGFRSLAAQLHEEPLTVNPADFALITSIFRSILRVHDVDGFMSQVTLRICDLHVARYAAALFSWSTQLTGAEDDPIYGELSIAFLRELSTIPTMAEYLATESVLAQISSASLLQLFRASRVKGARGYGPLDAPTRMHVIWSRGILPIVLNILVAVGEFFAEEATAFLNSFPEQLSRCATSLSNKPISTSRTSASVVVGITLNGASELHTLSILAVALAHYKNSPAAAAAPGGVIPDLHWDAASVRDDLETWLAGRRATLRDRMVPCSDREVSLLRSKPLDHCGESESRLEEMIVGELSGALSCLTVLNGAAGGGDVTGHSHPLLASMTTAGSNMSVTSPTATISLAMA